MCVKGMGANLSSAHSKSYAGGRGENNGCGRDAGFSYEDAQTQTIVPGLPNEVGYQILARLPRSCHPSLKQVCSTWNGLLKSAFFYDLRRHMGMAQEWLYVLMEDLDEQLVWFALDPDTGRWKKLLPMPLPLPVQGEQKDDRTSYMRTYGRWIFHSIFRERVALKGCSPAALDGRLFVVGGCLGASLSSVWSYDARTDEWSPICSMATARGFCQTASLHSKLYAVGGVKLGIHGDFYPLKSMEVYDPITNRWAELTSFGSTPEDEFSNATTIAKPMITNVIPYKDQLCISQGLCSHYFKVNDFGEVFQPSRGLWSRMPRGMLEGWPSLHGGAKLITLVNGQMVALDLSNSLDGVQLKLFDDKTHEWKVVCKKIPILYDIVYPQSPCLIAGFKTKLYIVSRDYSGSVTVLCANFIKFLESDGCQWEIISTRKFGSMKLVACQVLDI